MENKEQTTSLKGFLGSGITRRWLLNNLAVVVLSVVLILAFVGLAMTSYYYESLRGSLVNKARTNSSYINRYMTGSYNDFYRFTSELVADYSDKDKVEIQIIDSYGRVMFSSTGLMAGLVPASPDVMDCLSNGKAATFIGLDQWSRENIASAVSPVYSHNGQVIGAVRLVSSAKIVEKQVGALYLVLALAGLLVLALVIIANQFFLRSIVGPVLKINELAKKIASGQYGVKLDLEFDDELGELCRTLNNMSEEIGRVEKVKNDFISSVSHELRTPLTAIGGWTETLALDHSDKTTMQQGLNIIHKETRRLSQMVEELLDFSRIESGGFKLHKEEFDMRGELYDAVFIYREALREEGMLVHYDEMEEPVMVLGDKHRMKQVFLNIIDNAAKYGADGKQIDIKIENKTQYGLITIKDYGQGIPANELPFVKEKFFKGSSKQHGTGIGLAVCSEIVLRHGGTLDINSIYGEGTTVTIYIPRIENEI